MKKLALGCAVMLLFTVAAKAQDTPKAEVFGGYSYVRVSDQGQSANFNGGSGSVSYNPSSFLGIVGDFGGYHYSQSGVGVNVMTYLFGPKFAYRSGRATPFVQALFGGARASAGFGGASATANAFAMALGGGMDWNATPHVGIRVVQAEYLLTKFNDGANNWQNNVRISTGVVFRW